MVFIGTTQSKASRYFLRTEYVLSFFLGSIFFSFIFYFMPNFYLAYFLIL